MNSPLSAMLREGRMAKGLKQTRAAEMLNLSQAYLSQVERGIRTPSLETAMSMLKLYDMTMTEADVVKMAYEDQNSMVPVTETERKLLNAWRGRNLQTVLRLVSEHLREPSKRPTQQ